jgi:hypothetical protein
VGAAGEDPILHGDGVEIAPSGPDQGQSRRITGLHLDLKPALAAPRAPQAELRNEEERLPE